MERLIYWIDGEGEAVEGGVYLNEMEKEGLWIHRPAVLDTVCHCLEDQGQLAVNNGWLGQTTYDSACVK